MSTLSLHFVRWMKRKNRHLPESPHLLVPRCAIARCGHEAGKMKVDATSFVSASTLLRSSTQYRSLTSVRNKAFDPAARQRYEKKTQNELYGFLAALRLRFQVGSSRSRGLVRKSLNSPQPTGENPVQRLHFFRRPHMLALSTVIGSDSSGASLLPIRPAPGLPYLI